ncbi:MAG TPA: acyltransferase [Erysipelotrichaceae bacterium]|nr:acyltransferase [Erysipelotrichaceae bacterium]
MRKIKIGIELILKYITANIFALFLYDRKFLTSKHFRSKYFGILAPGWGWICSDAFARLFFGINKGVPFPVSPRSTVAGYANIEFHVDDLNNFQGMGCYFQAFGTGKIKIGKGSLIAPNVGLITTNHNPRNPEFHIDSKDIIIGEKCWIGMNSVILPGVKLGENTTVGAGSVVTKSFEEGQCIIAGNPAKLIKKLY